MAAKFGGRINFTKLGIAVIDELTGILRDLLTGEIKPSMIAKKVKSSTNLPKLPNDQELLIDNSKIEGYTDFDTTLLYTLLRNECPNIPQPTNGWGKDPGPTDITAGDDIERIRLILNKVLGFISTASVPDLQFRSIWAEMEDICQRMQHHLGNSTKYVQNLQQLESQSVDEELETTYIGKLQSMVENDKELTEIIQVLSSKVEDVKTNEKNEVEDVKTDVKELRSLPGISTMAKAIVLCDLCKAATVEMHCHLCATNLCDDCITKHTSSDDEKAHELVHHKVLPILQETRELKTSIYPNIKHKIAEIENEIAETEHEIKMKNGDLEALKEHHTEMTTRLSLLYFRITENNKLIRSNNIEDMENYQSIICEYRDPPKKHSLDTVRDLKHLILFPYEKSKIQTLYHSTLPENGVLFNVDARLGPQKVWVSGNDHKIRCYNMQGSIQQTVLTTTRNPPNGIALTLHGEVIFTDQAKKSINIFRYGKTEKIVTLQGWVPNQICCSASGEFLVTMYNPGETSRVVRYLWSTEKQVIQYDEKKKPLFSSEPLFIAENSNTDMICVSDCGTRKVMVLSQAGKLKSIYTGNLSSKKFKSFTPRGLVIDCNGQILVADIKNQCIHIIDNDGFLISYIQCELKNPYDLSFDSHNTLYVAEFTTGEVSAIKYIS